MKPTSLIKTSRLKSNQLTQLEERHVFDAALLATLDQATSSAPDAASAFTYDAQGVAYDAATDTVYVDPNYGLIADDFTVYDVPATTTTTSTNYEGVTSTYDVNGVLVDSYYDITQDRSLTATDPYLNVLPDGSMVYADVFLEPTLIDDTGAYTGYGIDLIPVEPVLYAIDPLPPTSTTEVASSDGMVTGVDANGNTSSYYDITKDTSAVDYSNPAMVADDFTHTTTNADGSVTTFDGAGNVISNTINSADGTVNTVYADGSKSTVTPDGMVNTTNVDGTTTSYYNSALDLNNMGWIGGNGLSTEQIGIGTITTEPTPVILSDGTMHYQYLDTNGNQVISTVPSLTTADGWTDVTLQSFNELLGKIHDSQYSDSEALTAQDLANFDSLSKQFGVVATIADIQARGDAAIDPTLLDGMTIAERYAAGYYYDTNAAGQDVWYSKAISAPAPEWATGGGVIVDPIYTIEDPVIGGQPEPDVYYANSSEIDGNSQWIGDVYVPLDTTEEVVYTLPEAVDDSGEIVDPVTGEVIDTNAAPDTTGPIVDGGGQWIGDVYVPLDSTEEVVYTLPIAIDDSGMFVDPSVTGQPIDPNVTDAPVDYSTTTVTGVTDVQNDPYVAPAVETVLHPTDPIAPLPYQRTISHASGVMAKEILPTSFAEIEHTVLGATNGGAGTLDMFDNNAADASKETPTSVRALNGTATINTDGTVNYVPDAGFSGKDYFSYDVIGTDGILTTKHMVIEVGASAPIDMPVYASDSAASTATAKLDVNALLTTFDAVDLVTTINGDAITVDMPSDASAPSVGNGTVSLNADGSVNYVPEAGFSGYDLLTYSLSSGKKERVLITVDSAA